MPVLSIWQQSGFRSVLKANRLLGLAIRPKRSEVGSPTSRHFHQSSAREASKDGSSANEQLHSTERQLNERRTKLAQLGQDGYPRHVLPSRKQSYMPIPSLIKRIGGLGPGETSKVALAAQGRIVSIRRAGSKLAFLDVVGEGGAEKIQCMLESRTLYDSGVEDAGREIKKFVQELKAGDIIAFEGEPHRTKAGELSIKALQIPTIATWCMHEFPTERKIRSQDLSFDQAESYVQMLTDPAPYHMLLRRSDVLRSIRGYLHDRGFIEVQTPILEATAGGAIARPFETAATEFATRKLNLRIAPELWLKRLVIGGASKIYEIGPSFRNEGLDKTHNPEFTTAEFYEAYATLKQLISMTEDLFTTIAESCFENLDHESDSHSSRLSQKSLDLRKPYQQLDFIPALNEALDAALPCLASPTARSELVDLFKSRDIQLPPNPTLPRLLDRLSTIHLEPQCDKPTWIINIPECLSPLSKSFIHHTAPHDQPVAARAELFVKGMELVNCYEEENSPFEQRRKFTMQHHYSNMVEHTVDHTRPSPAVDPVTGAEMYVDESYLSALEWGLPPTGGWGCGIDRLVMLFTGKDRIGDVLSFGNLRRVTRFAKRRTGGEDAGGGNGNDDEK